MEPDFLDSHFDLSPAKWIWIPCERTPPCTFVFFRHEFTLTDLPTSSPGWISADSRYLLYVNGERIQFGPAPFDPRHAEADPVEISKHLRVGKNVIAVQVLFYGHGDGTSPTGQPGLICKLDLGSQVIVTDQSWTCSIDRSHRPGRPKRWYLRALQEEYDATLAQHGWNQIEFVPDEPWHSACEISGASSQSSFGSNRTTYDEDTRCISPELTTITPRRIGMMRERDLEATLVAAREIKWQGDPNDWFDFRIPVGYEIFTEPTDLDDLFHTPRTDVCLLLTYALPKEVVGFPFFELESNKSIRVELIVNESQAEGQELLDTHFYTWSRFISDPKQVDYECFDYECCRLIQLHLSIPEGAKFRVHQVGIRERVLLDSSLPVPTTEEEGLNLLFEASAQTLLNSAQETIVDGMARERQQYAGDCSHQLHAVRLGYGEHELSRRFLEQYGHGQMLNGVWFDSWPGYDRYARLAQRQIGATGWGSLVDHSMGFVIDHVNHWLETGDRLPFEANRSKIEKFERYLNTIRDDQGLLKVDDIGAEAVWIDHDAYQAQTHKQLALNLYWAQMKVMLSWLTGAPHGCEPHLASVFAKFFDEPTHTLRVNPGEPEPRYCDRSLSHLIWLHRHGLQVVPNPQPSIAILTNQPKSLGMSYPANAVWRHWAWASLGRVDLILKEYRERWVPMYSVQTNGTIQEMWEVTPGTRSLMSHCAVSPSIMVHHAILGVGFEPDGSMYVRPQLGDLNQVNLTSYTPDGQIRFSAVRAEGRHRCHIHADSAVAVRTRRPISAESIAIGSEFQTLLRGGLGIEFDVEPYPMNEII